MTEVEVANEREAFDGLGADPVNPVDSSVADAILPERGPVLDVSSPSPRIM